MAVWLTDLADAARSSGLRVIEISGWRTRGHGGMATRPQGLLCHHTAGRPTVANPYPSLGVVRDGRPDLDGPLAQLGLGGDCAVRVIAAGMCWHAGATWLRWQSNPYSIGIEAEHPGGSALWPADMYEAYVALAAALREWYDLPLSHVVGHKEAAKPLGRKPDPTFNMTTFRTRVANHATTEGDDVTPEQMQELKDHQREMCRIYAVANNNYTRQVLSTATKAILEKLDTVDEATALAVEARLQDDFAALEVPVMAQAAELAKVGPA